MLNRHIKYQISNHMIQDWVQLPTKDEMVAYRKTLPEHMNKSHPDHIKNFPIVTSSLWKGIDNDSTRKRVYTKNQKNTI